MRKEMDDIMLTEMEECQSESSNLPSLEASKLRHGLSFANIRWKLLHGWFVLELKKLLKLSIPIALSIMFQISLLWISLLFLGHLPDREESDSYQYSAAGLASAFLNVTGIAIGHGIATAADTLSSQAYGYKNYKRVGVILQRGILILGLVMFPIWAVWLNTESLLLIVQQSPCVASFSALYVKVFTLALPFVFLYILLQHYLQSQSIVWQFVLIGLTSNIINVILHAITIYGIGIGFTGAVVSLVISNTLPPLMVIGYMWCRKLHKETWGGWSFESLEEWWLFIKLAIPGTLMLILEWWSFEIINFLAGAWGEVELSANIVLFQVVTILFMPTLGLTIATSIRVGNELGAGNHQGAKRASYTAVVAVLVFSAASSVFIVSTKDVLSHIFIAGDDKERADMTSKLLLIGFVFVICDNVQAVIGGALRGSGRQYIGAIVNFIAYYVIGLPLGLVIGFKTDLGILGVWIGMTIGNMTQCVVFVIVLMRTNWEKLSNKAIQRAKGLSTSEECTENLEERESTSSEADTSSLDSTESVHEDRDNLLSDVELQDEAKEQDRETVQATTKKSSSYRIRKLFIHGSFFVVGVGVLIAGGVASHYHPHVDPEEYYNCTTDKNTSYFNHTYS